MAAAGHADGFELTLDCPNDRYINDQAICVAVGGMLARIGIRLRIDARPKAIYFPKLQRHDTSFYLLGYGSIDAQSLLDNVVHTPDAASGKGGFNYGRLSDPDVDRLIDAAGLEMDADKRAATIGQVQRLLQERHRLLPLHRPWLTWAARPNVHVILTPDNLVHVDWIRIE